MVQFPAEGRDISVLQIIHTNSSQCSLLFSVYQGLVHRR